MRGRGLCIASQAPGKRAHVKGLPFYDPSGVRLRNWLGLDESRFYDPALVAIVPMGHCFPGYDAKGGDLPPRRECARLWREPVFARLPRLDLILTIGIYAQRHHLGPRIAGRADTDRARLACRPRGAAHAGRAAHPAAAAPVLA